MDRNLYSKTFTSCTNCLSKEVTEIDTMKQGINTALIANSSSEFPDEYLSSQYNSIYNSMNQKRENIVNHQIYLGKRSTYLNNDDVNNAKKMDELLEGFGFVSMNIESMLQDIYASSVQLASGNISLYAIVSEFELDMASEIEDALGGITYEVFAAMGQKEQDAVIKKALDIVNKYIQDGRLKIPEAGRVEFSVVPGVTLYCYGNFNSTIANDVVAVDHYTVAHDACVHIMGTDEFKGLDVATNKDFTTTITSTKQLDENTSIYITSGYDYVKKTYFAEQGVKLNTDPATFENTGVNTTVTAAYGVEIYQPSNWKYDRDVEAPIIRYQYQPVIIIPLPPVSGVVPELIPEIQGLTEVLQLNQAVPAY